MGSPSYENSRVSERTLPNQSTITRIYIPQYSFVGGGEDGGELFDQMGSVTRFLQLVDDASDDFIIDPIDVYLHGALGTWRRWRRIVVGCPSTTLGSLGKRDIFGGREGGGSRSRC